MVARKKKEEVTRIEIIRPQRKIATFPIVGESELRVHRLGKKAKMELDNSVKGKKARKKEPRVYQREFMDSLYFIDKNCDEIIYDKLPEKITAKMRFGFPASGFKKAMVSAVRQFKNVTMAEVKGAFFVEGNFVEIMGEPELEGFWRRIGGKGPGTGTPDWGIRGMFKNWKAVITVRYVEEWITAESIANLLDAAGFAVGVGENRPEKSGGSSGMWRIA